MKTGEEAIKQRVSVEEAASILGVRTQAVREHMKRGIWDLGEVIEDSSHKKQYIIFRPKLNRLVKELKKEGAKKVE